MSTRKKLRLGISSCLLGRNVRYDGGHKKDDFLVRTLGEYVEWVPVCPELEVGMGVPRESIRLVGLSATPRLVAERSGTDWTEPMRRFAEERVAKLATLDLVGYVTKKDSPSCGLSRVRVWTGKKDTPPSRDGVGAFVSVLVEKLPLLPIEEEGRLHDPWLRESFVERIFGYGRFREAVEAGMTRGALVAFHTRHKLALLAHSPKHYQKLGRIVAGLKKGRIDAEVEAYGKLFLEGLGVRASRGKHVNVLQHVAGYFRDVLAEDERKELEGLVSDYRRGLVPLVVPQTLVRHHVRRHGIEYLAGQSYLDPDPKELMLRNHV